MSNKRVSMIKEHIDLSLELTQESFKHTTYVDRDNLEDFRIHTNRAEYLMYLEIKKLRKQIKKLKKKSKKQ